MVSSDGMFVHADDFKVSAGETLAVKSVELSLFTTYGPIESVDLKFFSDDNGKPGSLIKTVSAIVPYAQISLGTVPGNELFRVYLDADLTFEGGNTGANYWMQPIVHEGPNGSQGAYWEFSTAGSLGAFMHRSESGGAWTPLSNRQAVFRLNCDHVVPEEPACNFNIMQDVEPITRMKMADVNHTSDAAVNGSPELEDFTNIQVHLNQGQTYQMALEGNTNGNWESFFTAFVDWNQNGKFNDPGEVFPIGSFINSTGLDGKQAINTIEVPMDAPLGATQMLIIKNFSFSPTNPCGSYSYGQGELYSVFVGEQLGVSDFSKSNLTYYPNPVVDILNINSDKKIRHLSVYSISGQKVKTEFEVKTGKVNLSNLTSGTYVIKTNMEDGSIQTFKIIKK